MVGGWGGHRGGIGAGGDGGSEGAAGGKFGECRCQIRNLRTKCCRMVMSTSRLMLVEGLVKIWPKGRNSAKLSEVSMPDSESTHKMLQNGGVDVSSGAR